MNRKTLAIARGVGAIGAVAALVVGITFANLTSNTVALSPNTLSSATAHLNIGLVNGSGCEGATDGPQTGMNYPTLVPGVASAPFDFCLKNTGDVPLNLTTAIPTSFSGTIPPSDVTLAMTCGTGSSSGTLDQYTGGTPLGLLANSSSTDCQATVTLNPSYSGTGGSVTPFDIDFVGTQ